MKTSLVACLFAMLLGGCEHLDNLKYEDYAGAPISSFWMPSLDGWTVVDDKALVIRTQLSKSYLVKVSGFCPNLKFANAIGVTSTAGSVDKFEKVIVGQDQCRIDEIRPLDMARMNADRKALKDKAASTRQTETSK